MKTKKIFHGAAGGNKAAGGGSPAATPETKYEDHVFNQERQAASAWPEWAKTNPEAYALSGGPKPDPRGQTHPDGKPQDDEDEPRGPVATVDPEEPLEPEEIILEHLDKAGLQIVGGTRPQILTALLAGLDECKAYLNSASSSREADAILQLLFLMGAAPSKEMSLKAKIIQAIIAKMPLEGLADLGREYGVSRADTSKIATKIQEFLGVEIYVATRNEDYRAQCETRCDRVHEITRQDRERAEEIRKLRKAA